MKVVSYYNVVPAKNKTKEKYELLIKFIQGVNAVGDTGIVHYGYNLIDSDVAVIQGWQHERGKNLPHLTLRQHAIDCISNKHVCTADSNLFLYATKNNQPHNYLRYSLDGIFPHTGNYFDNVIDPKRWKQISKDCNIKLHSPVKHGSHILICAQRDGGWSMGKTSLLKWLIDTCNEIRKHSSRNIIIRLHPKDKQTIRNAGIIQQHLTKIKNVSLSFNKTLEDDLKFAWAVVNHNSSSIVGPIIKGYSAFVTDPVSSQCAEVAHTDFSKLESPEEFDRQRWLERISMFHWKFSELEDGTAWRHMRDYCFQ